MNGLVVAASESDGSVARYSRSRTDKTGSLNIGYFDPRPLLRHCIGVWLKTSFPTFPVTIFSSVHEMANATQHEERFALFIYYVGNFRLFSPQVVCDIAILTQIANRPPLVLLAEGSDPVKVAEAFNLGAQGYVPTSLDTNIALEALRLVCAGGTYAPTGSLLGSFRTADDPTPTSETLHFTVRETQILRCLRKGMPNKLIAYELRMSEATAKVHIRNIMKKLNVTNRMQIVLRTWDYIGDERHTR